MNGWRAAVAVAGKDLRAELRGRHAFGSIVPFAATVLIAFGFALGPGHALLVQVAPGLLWLAVLFAAVLLFRGSYEAEAEDGALEWLLLAPVEKAWVFLGKTAAVAVQLVALLVAVSVLVTVLFGLPVTAAPGTLVATYLLGALGLAAIGALFGVLAVMPRAREAVLPLLVLPLVTPVVIAAIRATALATLGTASAAASWLGLLLAFDLVFVAAGTLVYGALLED